MLLYLSALCGKECTFQDGTHGGTAKLSTGEKKIATMAEAL